MELRNGRHRLYLYKDPSCVLWIPFYLYGTEQSKAFDLSGNNNHGTIYGSSPAKIPIYSGGDIIGYCVLGWEFDGVDDYLQFEEIIQLNNHSVAIALAGSGSVSINCSIASIVINNSQIIYTIEGNSLAFNYSQSSFPKFFLINRNNDYVSAYKDGELINNYAITLANILDESGNPILDESGLNIKSEAALQFNNFSVSANKAVIFFLASFARSLSYAEQKNLYEWIRRVYGY